MERGLEIFFSSSVLKEEGSPPLLLRYGVTPTSEKGRGGNPIKENRFLISRSCYRAVGFSGSLPLISFFFLSPPPRLFRGRGAWKCVCDVFLRLLRALNVRTRVCACVRVCMHEHNVDHRTVGCINNVRCGKYLGARDSPIFVTRCARERVGPARLLASMDERRVS